VTAMPPQDWKRGGKGRESPGLLNDLCYEAREGRVTKKETNDIVPSSTCTGEKRGKEKREDWFCSSLRSKKKKDGSEKRSRCPCSE